MNLQICCVRDVRGGVFGNPFFVTSIGMAMRQFEDEVNRPEETNTMYKHPEDFELYHLGTFDSRTAQLVSYESPLQLSEGRSCVRQKLN